MCLAYSFADLNFGVFLCQDGLLDSFNKEGVSCCIFFTGVVHTDQRSILNYYIVIFFSAFSYLTIFRNLGQVSFALLIKRKSEHHIITGILV